MRLCLKKILFCFGVAAGCFLPLFITGCSGTKVIVPAVNVEKAQTFHSGKFVWFDLFTTDIELAAPFYEELFGWTLTPVTSSSPNVMTIICNNEPIGNMVQRKKKGVGSKWLSYLSVADFDSALKTIDNAQGKIIHNIGDLPDRGRVAIVSDNQEATFAIIKSSSGDPDDDPLKPNQWVDCELWTVDVDTAVRFYRQMVQYEPETVQLTKTITYTQLMKEGLRRGGIVKIPWDDIHPEWIPYIAVRDIGDVTARVRELGGKVLLEPEIKSLDGRVAVIADPTGAVLGLQQIDEGGKE